MKKDGRFAEKPVALVTTRKKSLKKKHRETYIWMKSIKSVTLW
jgi:hypothetical protein